MMKHSYKNKLSWYDWNGWIEKNSSSSYTKRIKMSKEKYLNILRSLLYNGHFRFTITQRVAILAKAEQSDTLVAGAFWVNGWNCPLSAAGIVKNWNEIQDVPDAKQFIIDYDRTMQREAGVNTSTRLVIDLVEET